MTDTPVVTDSAPLYRVFLEEWQYNCCGPWPAVGLESEWRRAFARPSGPDDPLAVRLEGMAEPVASPSPGVSRCCCGQVR